MRDGCERGNGESRLLVEPGPGGAERLLERLWGVGLAPPFGVDREERKGEGGLRRKGGRKNSNNSSSEALSHCTCIFSFLAPYKQGTIFISILQMNRLAPKGTDYLYAE